MSDHDPEYEVGYGRPPKEGQFAKGQSGNPRGRPRGSKNLATSFHQITQELIHVTENGKSRTVTKLDAILLQMVNKAVSGDLKAIKEILQWNQAFESAAQRDTPDAPDTQKNAAFMKQFMERIRTSRAIEDQLKTEMEESNNVNESRPD